MTQVMLTKEFKGLPAGTLVWAKPVTSVCKLHTLWRTSEIKAYLGCVDFNEYCEKVEGVAPVAAVYQQRRAA